MSKVLTFVEIMVVCCVLTADLHVVKVKSFGPCFGKIFKLTTEKCPKKETEEESSDISPEMVRLIVSEENFKPKASNPGKLE